MRCGVASAHLLLCALGWLCTVRADVQPVHIVMIGEESSVVPHGVIQQWADSSDSSVTDSSVTDSGTASPVTDSPTTDSPTTDSPTTNAPTTDSPTTNAPTTDSPTTDSNVTDSPTTESSVTDPPVTEAPDPDSSSSGATLLPINVTTAVHTYSLTSLMQLRETLSNSCSDATFFLSLSGCDQSLVPLYAEHANPVLLLKPDATCPSPPHPNVLPLPNLLPLHDVITSIFLNTKKHIAKVVIFYTEDMATEFHALENQLHRQVIQTEEYLVAPTTSSERLYAWINQSLLHDGLVFNHFIVLCTGSKAVQILQQANHMESHLWNTERAMIYYRWLFVVVDPSVVAALEDELADILNVAVLLYDRQAGTDTDQNLELALEAFTLALNDTVTERDLSVYQPSCSHTEDQDELLDRWAARLRNTSALASGCSPYRLYVTTGRAGGGKALVEEEAMCTHCSKSGWKFAVPRPFPNENSEFGGRTFRVGVQAYEPFLSENVSASGEKTYGGLCMDLLNELADQLNFTYTLIEPADAEWGKEDEETGQWSGLVGMMQRKEADLVIAPLFLTEDRQRAMDFTTPYLYETLALIFKPPDENETKWRVVIEPFRWHVWMALFCGIFMTGLVAWAMTNLSFKLLRKALENVEDMFRHLRQAMWYVIGAVLTQGGAFEPQTIAVRCIIGSWWLVCIILVGTYSGNLIAFLTIAKSTSPFQSLEDVVSQSRYKWGMQYATAYHNTFMRSKDPLLEEMWEKVQKFQKDDPSVLSKVYNDHVEKTKGRDYIFIVDTTAASTIRQDDCEQVVMTLTKELPVYSVPIGLQKNSSLKAKLDHRISRLRESGMVAFWKQKYWPENLCEGISIASAKPVDLLDTQSAFFVLTGGLCVALAILLGEKLYSWHKKKHITMVKPVNILPHEEKQINSPRDKKAPNASLFQAQAQPQPPKTPPRAVSRSVSRSASRAQSPPSNGAKPSVTTISNTNIDNVSMTGTEVTSINSMTCLTPVN